MRAAVRCAIVVGVLVAGGRAGSVPVPSLGEPSCEEKCRLDSERDAASCEESARDEGARSLCLESARARRDVCLRICDD